MGAWGVDRACARGEGGREGVEERGQRARAVREAATLAGQRHEGTKGHGTVACCCHPPSRQRGRRAKGGCRAACRFPYRSEVCGAIGNVSSWRVGGWKRRMVRFREREAHGSPFEPRCRAVTWRGVFQVAKERAKRYCKSARISHRSTFVIRNGHQRLLDLLLLGGSDDGDCLALDTILWLSPARRIQARACRGGRTWSCRRTSDGAIEPRRRR